MGWLFLDIREGVRGLTNSSYLLCSFLDFASTPGMKRWDNALLVILTVDPLRLMDMSNLGSLISGSLISVGEEL